MYTCHFQIVALFTKHQVCCRSAGSILLRMLNCKMCIGIKERVLFSVAARSFEIRSSSPDGKFFSSPASHLQGWPFFTDSNSLVLTQGDNSMTIILFLVDTSASMNQRTYMGTTLLDTAKGAVETFMRIRQRDPNSRGDRYMLLTFEEPPMNIKSGWRENHATFINELKNLQAAVLTRTGEALRYAFDLLNVNRMTSMIDTYGQGRCPYYLEPCMLIAITDGQTMTSASGTINELMIPTQSPLPGSELTKEPFRWDQRLFAICLRLSGHMPQDSGISMVPSDTSSIDAMCEVTGGRSYSVNSHRQLNQCLESLVQKVQPGVVMNFVKIGPDPSPVEVNNINKTFESIPRSRSNSPVVVDGSIRLQCENELENCIDKENTDLNMKLENNIDEHFLLPNPLTEREKRLSRPSTPTPPLSNTAWHNVKKLIYVQKSAQKGYSVGHWPIPEAFWPDLNSPTLAPRLAHPIIRFSCTPCEPMVIDNLPFDKYELEPSPLTQYILERKQPHVTWQVFVQNSAKHSDVSHPFGYLKASTALNCVNLFVMPYNYPVLLPLLEELFKVYKGKPPPKWRKAFDIYLQTMPVYYAGPLRRALHRMGAPNLIPDNMDNCLSYSVLSYLKKVKFQAKVEFDRLVSSVGQRLPPPEGTRVQPRLQASFMQRKEIQELLHNVTPDRMASLKAELNEYSSFTLRTIDTTVQKQSYRNPFDISRKDLLDQIARMRGNFLQTTLTHTRLVDDDHLHSIPVGSMGNYQDYLKNMPPPLREVEAAPARTHMFGNPFKVNKAMMVDEADLDLPGMPKDRKQRAESPVSLSGPWKRKPGPLSPDVPYRRPPTPLNTPPASPPAVEYDEKLPEECMETEVIKLEGVDVAMEIDSDVNDMSQDESLITDSQSDSEVSKSLTNDIGNNEVFEENFEEDIKSIEGPPVDGLINNHIKHLTVARMSPENRQLRRVVFKELRKPGRNFDQLFDELNKMQGDLATRLAFVQDVVNEAMRYKRKRVVELLEEYKQSMIQYEQKHRRKSRSLSGSSVNR